MATPALELLKSHYREAEFTVIGSAASTGLFTRDPQITKCFVDESRQAAIRIQGLYALAKKTGPHDLALTFQNTLLSALFLQMTGSKTCVGYEKEFRSLLLSHAPKPRMDIHQVKRYAELVTSYLETSQLPGPCRLIASPFAYPKPTVGINPGAAYGEAKRWYPGRFAEVAAVLSAQFDIVLFGGKKEIPMCAEIEQALAQKGVSSVTNLAGTTTVEQLIDSIAGLSLFITNDSGPMHIASAFQIPTVAIFGPTDPSDTGPWGNPKTAIVRHEIECAPCKKRVCPLGHHACMEKIDSERVLTAVEKLLHA